MQTAILASAAISAINTLKKAGYQWPEIPEEIVKFVLLVAGTISVASIPKLIKILRETYEEEKEE